MRVLICGDRNWIKKETIRKRLESLPWNSIIIHGDARGADKIAGSVAEEMGLRVEKYPAEWQKHGRSAGPRRNIQMLSEGKPDLVIAFHTDISASKGTKHMLKISQKAGVKTELITGVLQIYTSHHRYQGADRLDITVKTGDPAFAPTWDLVMGSKNGHISEEKYKERYYQLMRQSYTQNRFRWNELLSQDRVTLVCFCPSGQFCHRLILAEILEKLGGKYVKEV
jgi:uncharacterized protein YeaO (DUF488 family)